MSHIITFVSKDGIQMFGSSEGDAVEPGENSVATATLVGPRDIPTKLLVQLWREFECSAKPCRTPRIAKTSFR
ncbi:hypothetical protein PsorP6_015297 [Peronosclerospora sorghi]|uniref:Uncharacterized protein n=1 Tax=Peronosclerospora sorghi TaxID=230839 RepID=A0ACC0VRN1_9STRA|nr:hypothetical protein PsorP6_015297 [Peronosclerospora sorghi]